MGDRYPTRSAHLRPGNPPVNVGFAAGSDFNSALENALLEIIERDSVWRAWVEGGATIERRQVPGCLKDMAPGPSGRFEIEPFGFPNDVGLDVAGALISDHATGVRLLGIACRDNWEAAVMKAAAEAFQLHVIANALQDPDAPVHRNADQGGALKPWRNARDYRALYRSDYHDLRDQLCHVQIYLDPDMGPLLDAQLVTARSRPASGNIAWTPSGSLIDRLADMDFEVIAVDVTTDDIRAAGFSVVRAVVPGMYSNAPRAFPFLGGRRLRMGTHLPPPLPYA